MAIISRIGVSNLEKSLNKITEISSKINFLQEELIHISEQLEDNEYFFSSGILSRQAFNGNKRNFVNRRKKVIREINSDVKTLKKLSTEVQKSLKANKL